MTRFTLIAKQEYDDAEITMNFQAECLGDVLERMGDFIRANGFSVSGQLDFVDDSTDESYSDDYEAYADDYLLQPIQLDQEYDFSDLPSNNWPFSIEKIDLEGKTDADKG
jgi:hypothetical protein